jgi:hypothetical protein
MWVCKPSFVKRLYDTDLQKPPILPVFNSKSKRKAWTAERERSRPLAVGENVLHPYLISVSEAADFNWVQLLPAIGPFEICAPTFAGPRPYSSVDPATICDSPEVWGPNILSELYMQQTSPTDQDWILTRQLVGWGGADNVYPPSRELIVSKRCYVFLTTCRIHSIDLDCAYVKQIWSC